MTGPGWRTLDAELDAWATAGRRATLWLRDDDAVEPTDALDRLLDLVDAAGVPLALAVIPACAKPALARRIARTRSVSVLQHGYAHANHSAAGAKKSEFADRRPLERMTGELVQGRAAIVRLFGEAAQPVLAPPWNRIAEPLIQRLASCGLHGVSRFKARRRAVPAPGVVEANAHVDLIAWRDGRIGKPADAVAGEIASHLSARRANAVDPDEPTGVLAHHLVMDKTAWASIEAIVGRLASDRRAGWLAAPEIFAPDAAA